MARGTGEQTGTDTGNQPEVIQANGQDVIALPDADFLKNADLLRDGQDLVLEGPDGSVIVIEGYFNADPAPLLQAPDGQALTPQLVNSFVHQAGPVQFAQAGTLDDETPVGAVKEVTGQATVTRTDGTTETVTIGTPIYEGDVIETSGEGAVNIVFIDETSLAVSQNAKLAIDEYVFDPSTESGTTDVSVLRGLFVFTSGLIGREDPDDVHIDTPMGSIGIRGTIIAGNINTGEITVMEGAIVLRGLNGSEVTLANQFETARFNPAGGDVVHMGQMSPDDFARSYDSMKSVAQDLFSGVQDSGQDSNSSGDGADTQGEKSGEATQTEQQGEGETAAAQNTAETTDAVAETTDTAVEEALTGTETTDATAQDTMITDTSFDGGSDAGFDFSAGTTDSTATTTDTSTTTTTTTTSGTTSFSGTTNTSGSTDPSATQPPPAPLVVDLTINRAVVDDDLAVSDVVAVIGNASAITGLSYSLLSATGPAGTAFALVPGAGGTAHLVLTAGTLSPTDTIDISVRATAPDGRSDTGSFSMTVDDLMTIDNLIASNVTGATENAAGHLFDVTAAILQDEAPGSQPVTWTVIDVLDAGGASIGAGAVVQNGGSGNVAQFDLSTPLDYETVGNQITVTLQADTTDDAGEPLTYTKSFVIGVANLDDEAPTLNTNTGTTVGENNAVTLTTALLSSSDIDTASANIVYSVTTAPANGQLELTTAPGTPILSFTQADLIAGKVKYFHDGSETGTDSFTFSVSDGINGGPTAQVFNITVSAINDAPVLTADTFAIDENSASGAAVGTVTTATDAEGNPLTFSETGNGTGANLFAIDSSGNITVQAGALLDFENVASYTYEVQVNDGNGGVDTALMTININDLSPETTAGTTGNDTIYGDTGDDTFIAANNDGSDTLSGGTQTVQDTYDASGSTNNRQYNLGASYNGTIADQTNGTHTDTFTSIEAFLAGTGSDTFMVSGVTTSYTLDGGTGGGIDHINYSTLSAANAVTVNLDAGTVAINGGAASTISNFENVSGTAGNDTLTGDAGNNIIWALGGNDTLIGGAGNDTLNGGAGNDTIVVTLADGSDTIDGGGAGTDIYDATAVTVAMTFNLTTNQVTGGAGTDSVLNIEVFKGGSGADTFIGNTANDTFFGNGGADSFVGGAGNDYLDGGLGTDTADYSSSVGGITIDMGAGTYNDGNGGTDTLVSIEQVIGSNYNDTLRGQVGIAETLNGGAGSDWLKGSVGGLDTLDGGSGIDKADYSGFGAANWINVTLDSGTSAVVAGNGGGDTLVGIENIVGTQGDDTIDGSADAFANMIEGDTGNDTLIGGTNDILIGGAGNDTLIVLADTNYNGMNVQGGAGTSDLLRFNTSGVFNTSNFANITGIEIIETADLVGSIDLTVEINTSLLANDTGTLHLNPMNGASSLTVDFGTYGGPGFFYLASDAASIWTYQNDATGEQVTVDYSSGAAINILGGFNSQVGLDLNAMTLADGIKITNADGNGFAFSAAPRGDRNNDGYDDLVFTKSNDPAVNNAVSYTLNGGPSLTNTTVAGLDPQTSVLNNGGLNNLDLHVAGAGDFNGDGILDYIVGSATGSAQIGGTGSAQIVNGGTGAVLANLTNLVLGDLTGQSISFAGDLNGDGYADVIIGAPGANVGGTDYGSAYVLFGDNYGGATETIDISLLGLPQMIGNPGIGSPGVDIETSFTDIGNTGFILLTNNTIEVFDLDNPAGPTATGTVINQTMVTLLGGYSGDGQPMDFGVTDIMVEGPLLYILTGQSNGGNTNGQITVLDISDPANPVFVDSFSDPALKGATALDMTPDGKLVAVIDGASTGNLVQFDVDPNGDIIGIHGTPLGHTALEGAKDVAVAGDYAYVVTGMATSEIFVANLSTANPSLSTTINMAGAASIYVDPEDGLMYVLSSNNGSSAGELRVYDIVSTPGTPVIVGSAYADAALLGATDVVVEHGIAYVTTSSGVFQLNVTDPATSIDPLGLVGPWGSDDNGTALALDNEGGLHVVTSSSILTSYDLHPAGMAIDGAVNTQFAGMNVAAAGDFDDDGFADFMVSMPGTDSVALVLGGDMNMMNLDLADNTTYIEISGLTDGDNDIPLFYLGDFSGDGASDIAVASDNEIHIFFGDVSATPTTNYTAGVDDSVTLAAAAGYVIVGASAAGDFNGDGFDDFVVAMRDTSGAGDMVSIYVVNGTPTTGTLDNSMAGAGLNDPLNAFLMAYQIPTNGANDPNTFDFVISSAGDVNGDGFSDIVIGTPDLDSDGNATVDGGAMVVYGRDTLGITSSGTATGNYDFLVGTDGNDVMDDGGFTGVSFRAGAGNDTITIGDADTDGFAHDFFDIDGGGGFDTLKLMAAGTTLDFTAIGSERVSNVEEIFMNGTNQTVVLGLNDIFDMMQGSPDQTAKLTGSTNSIFVIELPDFEGGAGILMDNDWTTFNAGETFLHDFGIRTAEGGGYSSFSFGGYELWISDAVLNAGNVIFGSNVVTDNNGMDSDPTAGNVTASTNGQTLVGSNDPLDVLDDGGFFDVSMFGGAGGDTFIVTNANFDVINGGAGASDTLAMNGDFDLRSFMNQEISHIETILVSGPGAENLTVNMALLTSMMASSDNASTLTIDQGATGDTLQVDIAGAGTSYGTMNTTAFQNDTGATGHSNNGTYDIFTYTGGQTLQIDQNFFIGNVQTI